MVYHIKNDTGPDRVSNSATVQKKIEMWYDWLPVSTTNLTEQRGNYCKSSKAILS